MRSVLALMGLTVLLAGCGEEGSVGGLLVLEGRRVIDAGSTLYGDLVVLDGEVELRPGAETGGSVYVLGGSVQIAGTVRGDVAVIGGEVHFTDDAIVIGGLRRGGGEVHAAGGASIGSELVSPLAVDSLLGLARSPTEPNGLGPWLIAQVAVLGLIAAVLAALAPRAVSRLGTAVDLQPLVPLALGVLGLIVGLSLFVFMLFTVVLIPVALLMALAAVLGIATGFVSLGQLAVRRLLGPAGLGGRRSVQAAVGCATLAALLAVATQLPLVGEVAVALVVATSLGAWLVTRFGTRDMARAGVDS